MATGVVSAGLLLHRDGPDGVEVLIAHMGGPYWARKDARAWSIPKGLLEPGEDPLAAARREFAEELGIAAPAGEPVALGSFRYSSGKTVTVFALAADLALDGFTPGTFEVEWLPRSGRRQRFPEVDDACWVGFADAREKLVAGQVPALDALLALLTGPPSEG